MGSVSVANYGENSNRKEVKLIKADVYIYDYNFFGGFVPLNTVVAK